MLEPLHPWWTSLHIPHKYEAKLLSHCVHPIELSNIHQNVIKYLTYLILIKRKLGQRPSTNNTATVGAPSLDIVNPSFGKEYSTIYYASWITMIRIRVTCSYSCWCMNTNIFFSFLEKVYSKILWSTNFVVQKSLYNRIHGYQIISTTHDKPWPW